MIEEPGRGYRRTVPSLLPIGIIEIEGIKQLVNSGIIVIAAGGGGVPVAEQEGGQLVGVEAVVGTENVANMFAQQLGAKVMLIVVEAAAKYILERLSIEKRSRMSLEELDQFLENRKINSRNVKAQLIAASKFLNGVGELVVITTLESLPSALVKESGLWIGNKDLPIIL
jgi:carbamate kinase